MSIFNNFDRISYKRVTPVTRLETVNSRQGLSCTTFIFYNKPLNFIFVDLHTQDQGEG